MNGNIATNSSLHLAHETHNTLVYGSNNDRLIVTIGVDDMVIIDGDDVLMVCKTDQSQKVKDVVGHLKKHHQEKYL
jgi:Trk K+ transport system NAD-binding subunit